MGSTVKRNKELAPMGADIFLLDLGLNASGDKDKNWRTTFSESAAFYHKNQCSNFRFDKLTIESDLKEKDSKMFVTAAEDKLQKSVAETESWKEKVARLEEDLHIAKENLQITITERESLTNNLEKVMQDNENIRRDFEGKKAELEERLFHLESERDELLGKLRTVEDEKIVQSGNTVEIQKLLEEKVSIIEGLEKRVEAMKNGFIWLQRIKENHIYTEVSMSDKCAIPSCLEIKKIKLPQINCQNITMPFDPYV